MKLNKIMKLAGHGFRKHKFLITGSAIIAGVAATSYLSATASFKSAKTLEELEYTSEESPKLTDKVKAVGRNYIPAVCAGGATVALVVYLCRDSKKKQIALASAYALSAKALRDYEEALPAVIKSSDIDKVKQKIAANKTEKVSKNNVIETGKGDVLFLDSLSGRYFRSDIQSVRKAVNDFNEYLNNNDYGAMNIYYECLGLDDIALGDELGWNRAFTGLLDPSYTHTEMKDGEEPCCVLLYPTLPIPTYADSF